MSAIYRIFIYLLDDNIASVVLFQDFLKTKTTKIPVFVLQKLSLLDFSFLECFIRKLGTICSIPWFSTCYISKSSTRWPILLFIVSLVLPQSSQKCRFHKIDMDFEIVGSTFNDGLFGVSSKTQVYASIFGLDWRVWCAFLMTSQYSHIISRRFLLAVDNAMDVSLWFLKSQFHVKFPII